MVAKLKFVKLTSSLSNILALGRRGERPPWEGAYPYFIALLVGYFIADYSVLSLRSSMISTQLPPPRPPKMGNMAMMDRNQYNIITDRNIFNADAVIAPPMSSTQGGGAGQEDAVPTLSQLPVKLEGTMVHANPKKSIATVALKGKSETKAVMVNDELEGLCKVTKIERRRLVFRNMNNNRLEYVEIPKEGALTFGLQDKQHTVSTDEVMKQGEFDFAMKRSDLNKYLGDLTGVLNQARMVPNIIPGSGGKVEGFRFVSINPGSVYEKLGFKPMDVIKMVNGDSVNSPTKAMELYNALKSEKNITMQVERDGKLENFRYNVSD